MPSLAQSTNIDRSRLTNDHTTPSHDVPMVNSPLTNNDGISPFMKSSLPVMASGGDLYQRQFYAGGRLPQRRFLPVGAL